MNRGQAAREPHAEQEHIDALAERFFSQDSLHPVAFDDEGERSHTRRESRTAMQVTFAMLGISAITFGAFLVYMRLIMPVPVRLGGDEDISVPDGRQTTATASTGEPTPPSAAEAPAIEPSRPTDPAPVAPSIAAAPSGDAATALVSAAADVAPENAAPIRPAALAPARSVAPTNDWVARAYGSLNRGDSVQALSFALRAVTEMPRRADAWIALGSTYDAMHDGERAREAFRSCLAQATGAYVEQCRELAHQ